MAVPMPPLEYFRKILLVSQFKKIPYPTTSFDGQTIIITGANSGVGLEAARHIVHLGARKVILAVRNQSKGEQAAADILTSTKATRNVVEVWPLDLSSYDSIKAFAKRVAGLDRVDAVLQNAGMATGIYQKTDSGEELVFDTNTLGAVLLGLLVLPKLRESARLNNHRARLAFIGSESFLFAQFKEAEIEGPLLQTLKDEEIFKANTNDRYMTSKLLLFYAIREIAARCPVAPNSNVVITTTTPGLCWSGLYRELPWFILPFFYILMTVFARTAEVGSRLLVDAVRPDLGVEAHGTFMMDCKPFEQLGPSIESKRAQEVAEKFTKELFGRLEEVSPNVTKVLN